MQIWKHCSQCIKHLLMLSKQAKNPLKLKSLCLIWTIMNLHQTHQSPFQRRTSQSVLILNRQPVKLLLLLVLTCDLQLKPDGKPACRQMMHAVIDWFPHAANNGGCMQPDSAVRKKLFIRTNLGPADGRAAPPEWTRGLPRSGSLLRLRSIRLR